MGSSTMTSSIRTCSPWASTGVPPRLGSVEGLWRRMSCVCETQSSGLPRRRVAAGWKGGRGMGMLVSCPLENRFYDSKSIIGGKVVSMQFC